MFVSFSSLSSSSSTVRQPSSLLATAEYDVHQPTVVRNHSVGFYIHRWRTNRRGEAIIRTCQNKKSITKVDNRFGISIIDRYYWLDIMYFVLDWNDIQHERNKKSGVGDRVGLWGCSLGFIPFCLLFGIDDALDVLHLQMAAIIVARVPSETARSTDYVEFLEGRF